jgi:hypothetical protein
MNKFLFASLLMVPWLPAIYAQDDGNCSVFNVDKKLTIPDLYDDKEHTITVGAPHGHGMHNALQGTCEYSWGAGGFCDNFCTINLKPNIALFENSNSLTLTSLIVRHVVAGDGGPGSAYATSGATTCGATEAAEAISCSRYDLLCGAGLTLTIGPVGINWAANSIWKNTAPSTFTCGGHRVYVGTPILIDTDGSGYNLSSSLNGVPFNFFGDGLVQTAWPVQGSTNGFLVLPDANFMVPTGKQMFGNQTGFANGFLQLVPYDDNQDGVIDARDAIYNQLYVWIDANRDGVSQPQELRPLRETIESISTHYVELKKVDDNGNAERYKGKLKPVPGSHVDPVVADWILSFR